MTRGFLIADFLDWIALIEKGEIGIKPMIDLKPKKSWGGKKALNRLGNSSI